MAGRLAGKVAIVTGATSGIGRCTASLFAAEGAKVVLAGRRASLGADIVVELGANARFVQTDVEREADVAALVALTLDTFGKIDVLFNNAGGPAPSGAISGVDSDAFDSAMRLILRSVFYGIKHVAPVMAAAGSGSIVSNASVAGYLGGYATSHIYAALKAGVMQLSKSVALELAESGVRVNTVSPGAIATGIFGRGAGLSSDDADATSRQMERMLKRAQPLGRAGLPQDVAAAVLFLASDDAGFITGRDLVIDGGMIAGRRFSDVEAGKAAMRTALTG